MKNSIFKEDGKAELIEKRMLLISISLFITGSIGYFSINRDLWVFYLFAHTGALGVLGLFGSLAGTLARRKFRGFWTAFSLGCLLPIISGIVAVLIFRIGVDGHLYCGGSVSLAVALLVIVFYTLVRNKGLL